MLGEWLEGYNEWHESEDPETGDRAVHLWDYTNGFRYLTDDEIYEILRQAAFILTCYYDQKSFRQIYPWHHGAGDFIVKTVQGQVAVKLITARQYEPLVHFEEPHENDKLIATIHFLLNLVLRMRFDRLDGVIEPVWLKPIAVHAAVAGFFDCLSSLQGDPRHIIGPAAEFLSIMQSFDSREIIEMYDSLLEIYADEDQDDFNLIKEELADHAAELHQTLQRYSLD
jgi:hypothetical protein